MESRFDFIQWLVVDISVHILMCLNDPSDLVRASSVSIAWRQFVIANGLCKQLCFRKFPEISSIADVIDANNKVEPVEVATGGSRECAHLKRDHRLYAFLARGLTPFQRKDCISGAISASSTDNYPEESIQNTLEPSGSIEFGASYWSSKGRSDPEVPETLSYELTSRLCMVTEIHVQPFEAYFQFRYPIYAAKAVRFRMGHAKFPMAVECGTGDSSAATHASDNDKFVWTYSSPEFPMVQENSLQKFMLPEPVLCTGGILQIELLGRVQRQEMDGLYYICISHVEAVGRPLLPAFDVEILDDSGKCTLKYYPEIKKHCSPTGASEREASGSSHFHRLTASIRRIERLILNAFLGAGVVGIDDDDDVHDHVLNKGKKTPQLVWKKNTEDTKTKQRKVHSPAQDIT